MEGLQANYLVEAIVSSNNSRTFNSVSSMVSCYSLLLCEYMFRDKGRPYWFTNKHVHQSHHFYYNKRESFSIHSQNSLKYHPYSLKVLICCCAHKLNWNRSGRLHIHPHDSSQLTTATTTRPIVKRYYKSSTKIKHSLSLWNVETHPFCENILISTHLVSPPTLQNFMKTSNRNMDMFSLSDLLGFVYMLLMDDCAYMTVVEI